MGDGLLSTGVALTLVPLCVGVIYQCGRLSARVESLEDWRREVREDFRAIRAAMERLADTMKGPGV